ncbi:MAG: class I SAM-dependent methyltransferase [Candidatus Peribacteraceae bacterium]
MQLDRRLFDGKVISSRVYPEFFPMQSTDEVVNLGCGVGPQAVVYKGNYKRMVGVDLNADRLEQSKVLLQEHSVTGYETLAAPVENTGLPGESFDHALAIDIIEHLPNPRGILQEAKRLLKKDGTLLLSVPAMHDHYVHTIKRIGALLGRRIKELPKGDLDAHNAEMSVRQWEDLVREQDMKIVSTRATTLWPPLHLYGVPRFWFTNPLIHAIDGFLCRLPVLKRFGQAYLMTIQKK